MKTLLTVIIIFLTMSLSAKDSIAYLVVGNGTEAT